MGHDPVKRGVCCICHLLLLEFPVLRMSGTLFSLRLGYSDIEITKDACHQQGLSLQHYTGQRKTCPCLQGQLGVCKCYTGCLCDCLTKDACESQTSHFIISTSQWYK